MYIIIDYEATCSDANEFPRSEMEIIEWGVVAVDDKKLLPIDEFQSFVRPVRNPLLTDFCLRLTSIKQAEVDTAPYFVDALANFKEWLVQFDNPVFCSWGNFDKNQLIKDCSYHGEEYPFRSDYHINLKKRFSTKSSVTTKLVSMAKALRVAGIEQTGVHHRGIDDARNIAKLMPLMFKQC